MVRTVPPNTGGPYPKLRKLLPFEEVKSDQEDEYDDDSSGKFTIYLTVTTPTIVESYAHSASGVYLASERMGVSTILQVVQSFVLQKAVLPVS